MAVQGHKERALQRRGLHIKEALQRRGNLNETPHTRRSLILESIDALTEECSKRDSNSVFCKLRDKILGLDSTQQTDLLKGVTVIRDFFTKINPNTKNEAIFKNVIEIILDLDAFANAIEVISTTLGKGMDALTSGELLKPTRDDIRKTLITFIEKGGEMTPEKLEELLKNVRMIGYQEYERGFVGNNFQYIGGRWRMPKLDLDIKSFWKLVLRVYKSKTSEADERVLSNHIIQKIINNKDEIFETAKADLITLEDLKVGTKVIFPEGSYIEVKKMDYATDSYMSEFFAIYKNSNLKKILEKVGVDNQGFMDLYNRIIDRVYTSLRDNGQNIIDEAESHIDGIMYDKNVLIPRIDEKGQKNFEFYWSNKGQRPCSADHRLSIRFRPLKEKVTGYIYNLETKSTQLTPQRLNLIMADRQFC